MINFYSDRKSDTGAHDVSSGIITDSDDNISQNPENASGDLSDGADKSDVSDELRFSLADYDEQTQDDIIAILTPYIGTVVDKTPAEIAAFYGQVAYKVIYPFLSVAVRIGPSYQNRMI